MARFGDPVTRAQGRPLLCVAVASRGQRAESAYAQVSERFNARGDDVPDWRLRR